MLRLSNWIIHIYPSPLRLDSLDSLGDGECEVRKFALGAQRVGPLIVKELSLIWAAKIGPSICRGVKTESVKMSAIQAIIFPPHQRGGRSFGVFLTSVFYGLAERIVMYLAGLHSFLRR